MKKTPTKQATKNAAGMLAGLQAGHVQAVTDRKLAGAAAVARAVARAVAVLPIAGIHPRNDDTRPARAEHVLALAESIAAVGLLQPPAVDKAHRLIAGLNRLTACRLLAAGAADRGAIMDTLDGAAKMDVEDTAARLKALPACADLPEPLKHGKVPVNVMTALDAARDPDAALAAEVAENTARKQYTHAEVAALVDRLRRAGYKETTGRPRKGEKALRPALGLVLGISPDTARRYLGTRKDRQVPTFSEPELNLSLRANRLRRALEDYTAAAGAVPIDEQDKTTRRAVGLASQLSAIL